MVVPGEGGRKSLPPRESPFYWHTTYAQLREASSEGLSECGRGWGAEQRCVVRSGQCTSPGEWRERGSGSQEGPDGGRALSLWKLSDLFFFF